MEALKSPYARLAWNHLIEVDEHDKYSCALYIPKNADALASIKGLTDSQKQQILDGAEQFKKTVIAKVNEEKTAKAFKAESLFKDGDEKADTATENFKAENPGKPVPDYCGFTRNMWVINIKSQYQPDFYGPRASEGKLGVDWAKDNIYGGCWVRADVRGYNWAYQGKKGYSLGLGGMVQKWMDDTSFEAGATTTEVEDALEVAPNATADDFLD
jgi:hypothetical protein